ncbi:type 4b pilus protein PilO2 [Salmonella enterica]|nr:type 4b pilus protein PilO2 [Salmonella enterica]EIQ2845064.1 type 4b pilus protein PilO2 [Salmonella enterica]
MMRKTLSALAMLCLLSGCGSLDRIDAVGNQARDDEKIASQHLQKMKSGEVVRELPSQWINPVPLNARGNDRERLPSCLVQINRPGVIPVNDISAHITRTCRISVVLTPDARQVTQASGPTEQIKGPVPAPDANGMLPLAQMGGAVPAPAPRAGSEATLRGVYWKGALDGFLDNVTARLGLSWRYEEGRIVIFYLDTRNFPVLFMDSQAGFTSKTVSGTTSSTGSSGGGSSGGISGDNNTSQSTDMAIKSNLYGDVSATVKAMLTPGVGRMNLSAGVLTVTDTSRVLSQIGRYIDDRNRELNRQVVLNVQIYSVESRRSDQLGIDWDAVLLGMTVLSAFQETRERQAYRSLALHILPLLPKDGYAVIPLSESTLWFVATLGGQLSPLSDIVGSGEQIKKAIDVFVTMNPQPPAGWQVIAPDGFLQGETQPPPALTDWLAQEKTRRTPRLSPTNVKAAAGLWIALLALLLAGHFGWQYLQERRENAEIAAAQAALAAKRAAAKSDSQPRPWASQARFNTVLRTCHNHWKTLPLSIAGWTFAQAQCSPAGSLSVNYALPEGGTVADFASRLPYWYPGIPAGFNIPGAANMASFTLTFAPPASTGAETLPDNATQTQRFTSFAQRLNAALQLTKQDNALRDDAGNIIPVPWITYAFTFVTDIPPDRLFLAQHFDDSGLRLEQVSLTQRDGQLTYTLEGYLYAAN